MSLPPAGTSRPPRRHTFMGVDIALHGMVLAPRGETELLGLEALRLLKAGGDPAPLVIDMCCGSGNLAIGLARAFGEARLYAADLTADAVETARANAMRLGLATRVAVRQGDMFNALQGDDLAGRASMIVCNPPYISTSRLDGDSAHLLAVEPREAFDGGPYGISIQQRLASEAGRFLKPGGYLLFEFGLGQERQARALLARARGYKLLHFVEDREGRPRVAVAQHAGSPP